MEIPSSKDWFKFTAVRPAGETALIAIVAPPWANIADLASVHIGLETITDSAAFFAELSKRLSQARLAEAPPPQPRGFVVLEQGGPPIATAMRKVMLVE